jgi:hypothetical protein
MIMIAGVLTAVVFGGNDLRREVSEPARTAVAVIQILTILAGLGFVLWRVVRRFSATRPIARLYTCRQIGDFGAYITEGWLEIRPGSLVVVEGKRRTTMGPGPLRVSAEVVEYMYEQGSNLGGMTWSLWLVVWLDFLDVEGVPQRVVLPIGGAEVVGYLQRAGISVTVTMTGVRVDFGAGPGRQVAFQRTYWRSRHNQGLSPERLRSDMVQRLVVRTGAPAHVVNGRLDGVLRALPAPYSSRTAGRRGRFPTGRTVTFFEEALAPFLQR